jgi:hypothetical protein
MSFKAIADRAPVVLHVPLVLNSAAVDQDIFIADRPYDVISVRESHAVAGNDAGSVTLDVKKCTGTTAAASGSTVLGSTFNMKSTANTVVHKTRRNGGVLTTPVATLAEGDRLALDITGTTTSYAGGVVIVTLRPSGSPSTN